MWPALTLLALAAQPLGLDEALALVDQAPDLTAAQAAAQERRASVGTISALSSNPTLTVLPGVRTVGGAAYAEGTAAVQQSFNLAGVQGSRRMAAQQEADQAQATAALRRWQKRTLVARTWLDQWAARRAVALAKSEADAARDLAARLERAARGGGVTRAEVAGARAFAAELEAQVLAWEGQQFDASAELALELGLDEPVPSVGEPAELPQPALDQPLALDRHPHVRLLDTQLETAAAREREARALWGTALHLTLSGGYEAQAQWLGTLAVGVTLPVFERGQADAAREHSLWTRLGGETRAAQRHAKVELAQVRHELEHTAEVYEVVHGARAPAAREALELETKRFAQGEVTLQDLVAVRRQALGAALAEVLAQADVLAARVRARELVVALEAP